MTTAAEFREAANKIIAADIIHSDEVVTLLWEAARQAEAIPPAMSEQQTADEIVEAVGWAIKDVFGQQMTKQDRDTFARAVLAAARPMIEAEERERCAREIATVEPDEEAAGCSASWGDFIQVAQSAIRAMGVETHD